MTGRGLWKVPTGRTRHRVLGRKRGRHSRRQLSDNANTRLISPSVEPLTVSTGERSASGFWHWFSFSYGDNGVVQISADSADWQTLSATPFDGASKAWTQFPTSPGSRDRPSASAFSCARIGRTTSGATFDSTPRCARLSDLRYSARR